MQLKYTIKNRADHVGVIPVSRPCERLELILVLSVVVDDAKHTVPTVINIVVIPPQVTDVRQQRVVRLRGERKREKEMILRTKDGCPACHKEIATKLSFSLPG